MRRITLLALILALLAGTGAVSAADRIVAVVNDQVITLSQLQARTELNLRQVGIAGPTDQQRQAVEKRSLSNLIDEELQRQYAKKAGAEVTKAELDNALTRTKQGMGEENWNTLTAGYTKAAEEKLAAEVQWQKIIERDLKPRVQVSTAEADRLIAELGKSRSVDQRQISVIKLDAGDSPEADQEKLASLQTIKTKLAAGESFEDLARAHSDDASAANGGQLGWFGNGELNPQLEESLDKMKAGDISDPIRTPLGWYLVKLNDLRAGTPVTTAPQTQIELFILASPAPSDKAAAKTLENALGEATGNLKSADDVRAFFADTKNTEAFSASNAIGWVTKDDLDPELAKAVATLREGRWSTTLHLKDTLARLYVAGSRQAMPEKLDAYREKVLNNMFGNRVELESRRFMQTLRQRAFLDIRL